MSVVSRGSRQKSWQKVAEVVSLLEAMDERERRLGDRLQELRLAHGLTQENAAPRVGVSYRQWQRWEGNESEPHAANLKKIADAFGISVAELLGLANGASQLDRVEAMLRTLTEQVANALEQLVARGLIEAVDLERSQEPPSDDEERPPRAA